MKFLIFSLALSLIVPSLAAALTQEEATAEFFRARESSALARKGDTSATERAFDQFARLTEANPQQPLYRAYYGSMYTIKARDAWFPFTKLRNVDAGTDLIGKALAALTPEHDKESIGGVAVSLETRLVAASTFASIPKAFGRYQQAKDVLADLLASPVFGSSPPAFQAAVYVQAAKIALKDEAAEPARANLQKAVEVAPNSPAADEARALLTKPGA
jgi:tetratricopeptide (TPR) repeat protein